MWSTKLWTLGLFVYICVKIKFMDKPFVYGIAVSGDNFTDRKKETKRLKMNFESGVNTILISPRRMGKTSIVGKVMSSMTDPKIKEI